MSDDEIICTACFYEIIDKKLLSELRMKNLLEANDKLICRSYLNMKRKNCNSSKPDLNIVMLNPGSCGKKIDIKLNVEVKVDLDSTLSRIKKIFEKCNNINWIKVLNLSNIRNQSSSEFFEMINIIEKNNYKKHSIFLDFDDSKLSDCFGKGDYVLLAWGNNKKSMDLRKIAESHLKDISANVINESIDNKTLEYFHPLVRKKNKWKEIVESVSKFYS